MPKTVPLVRVPSDWLLQIVEDLRRVSVAIKRGDDPTTTAHQVERIAADLEPTARMYIEKERLERKA